MKRRKGGKEGRREEELWERDEERLSRKGKGREKRDRDRQADRERDRQRQRDSETEKDRQKNRQRQKETDQGRADRQRERRRWDRQGILCEMTHSAMWRTGQVNSSLSIT